MDLKLPPLGEGVDSGSVVGILVHEGDQIAKGQGVIELETGKAVAPVPAPSAGKVTKILVAVGDKISVGQSILSMEGSAAPAAKQAAAPAKAAARPSKRAVAPAKVEEEPEAAEAAGEELPDDAPMPAASPSIRRMARQLGIDLRRIQGSENGGRIVIEDVRAYIQRLQRRATEAAAARPSAPSKPAAPRVDFAKWGPVTKRPMSALRKAIASHMSESWQSAPRVTQFGDADITALNDSRKKHAAAYEKKGARLTLTSFALKIVAAALREHPVFNTSLDEASDDVIYKEYVHLGLAVDTEQGLIVPVLRDVDKKDLLAISKEMNEIAAKTRDRKISLEEMQGGSFTLSNQGGIGGGHFTPIINRPETAILGLGRGAMKAVVREGKIEARLMLPLALSYDHRVIDGGAAVQFMLALVKGFENFDEKLLTA
ncbi:MAG TPA: 2-oxo acid dehydrogenase subunit E2 [Verrucomicrobiae bacterium]|jgi:pyruvate dehydrogenase E2 component (dihydrolipoamide acetyltransferase)